MAFLEDKEIELWLNVRSAYTNSHFIIEIYMYIRMSTQFPVCKFVLHVFLAHFSHILGSFFVES